MKMGMLNPDTMMAGLLWSSIGAGFFVYGKKNGSAPALICGCSLFGISLFVYSPIYLSLVSIAVIAASVFAIKRGY
jgi:hypothetical protein